MDERFLVFGATGYTGRHVVSHALARGIAVSAHVRPGSPRGSSLTEQWRAQGVRVCEAPWEPDAVAALVADEAPSHVFLMLGITRRGAKAEAKRTGASPTYQKVDAGYSMMVIDACAGQAVHVLYLSSLGAGGAGGNAYLQARTAVEGHLAASALAYTVVRPSFITGDDRGEDRPLERIGSRISDLTLSVARGLGATRIADRYGTVTGDVLGGLCVRAALEGHGQRRVLDLSDLRS